MQSSIKYAILGLIFMFSLLFFSDWWLYIVMIWIAIFFILYFELWLDLIALTIVIILMIALKPIFINLPPRELGLLTILFWLLCKKYLLIWLGGRRNDDEDLESDVFDPKMLIVQVFFVGILTLDIMVANIYEDKQENLCGIVEKDSYSDDFVVKGEYKKHILSHYIVEVGDKVCVTYLPHEKSPLPKDYTYSLEKQEDIDSE